MTEIFIPYHVPSFKNSKVVTRTKKIVPKKSVVQWRKKTKPHWISNRQIFLDACKNKSYPYKIGFHFVRRTKHRWDFNNITQGVTDEMVRHGWIEDDNMNYLLPFPYKRGDAYYTVDKQAPGVWIRIY